MREKCNTGNEFQELFDLLEKQGADEVGVPPSFKLFCGFALMGDELTGSALALLSTATGSIRWITLPRC